MTRAIFATGVAALSWTVCQIIEPDFEPIKGLASCGPCHIDHMEGIIRQMLP